MGQRLVVDLRREDLGSHAQAEGSIVAKKAIALAMRR